MKAGLTCIFFLLPESFELVLIGTVTCNQFKEKSILPRKSHSCRHLGQSHSTGFNKSSLNLSDNVLVYLSGLAAIT